MSICNAASDDQSSIMMTLSAQSLVAHVAQQQVFAT